MITTAPSDKFFAEISQSHTIAVEVELIVNGIVTDTFQPTAGSVAYDANAAVRRTLDLTFMDDPSSDTLVPSIPTDPLAPYGNRLRVARGVRYTDGSIETMNLGIFRIDETDSDDTGDGLEIRLTGQNKAADVSDAKFEEPYNIASGTLFTDAILAIIEEGLGGPVQHSFVNTAVTTPGLVAEEGDDRWELALGLAEALGAELFFDREDVLILRPVPQALDNPVATVAEGEHGVLIEANKRWTRVDAFNRVIVTSENSDTIPPIRGVATDDNPLSPTYYYGPFGRVPKFYSNPYITTQTQADDAAAGILASQLGTTQQIDFGAVVNPTLEASDVIQVARERLGVDEAHVIDTLTIPLDAESSMTGTTRAVQIQS